MRRPAPFVLFVPHGR